MNPSALLLPACLILVPQEPGDSPPAVQDSVTNSHVYPFTSTIELVDFDSIQGTWTINDGCLLCGTKGARDEIQWRRALSSTIKVQIETTAQGSCGIELRGSDGEVLVTWNRQKCWYAIERDRAVLKEGSFARPEGDLLTITLQWSPPSLSVQFGADDACSVILAEPAPCLLRLSLLSLKSQAKFQKLVVERSSAQNTSTTLLEEEHRLAMDRAERLGAAGEWEKAFEEMHKLLPKVPPKKWRDELPEAVLDLFTRAASHLPRMRARPPLQPLMEEARVVSEDESICVYLPFRPQWTATAPRLRRVDGNPVEIRCSSPPVSIDVFRYDQRHNYWFGEEPKLQFVGGSSSAALNKARFSDLVAEHPDRMVHFEPREQDRVGGEIVSGFEIDYELKKTGEPPRRLLHREMTLGHRGNTLQISILGAPEAVASVEHEIQWLLTSLELRR